MRFDSGDHVRRIGQQKICTVKDVREPDEHVVRLNPAAEAMYSIQFEDDPDTYAWAKESELEPAE